jgi:hypothetical protein
MPFFSRLSAGLWSSPATVNEQNAMEPQKVQKVQKEQAKRAASPKTPQPHLGRPRMTSTGNLTIQRSQSSPITKRKHHSAGPSARRSAGSRRTSIIAAGSIRNSASATPSVASPRPISTERRSLSESASEYRWDDQADANEEIIVVDEVHHDLLDRWSLQSEQVERIIRKESTKLRERGWSKQEILLYQRLQFRGKQQLLPLHWMLDLDTIPLSLFVQDGSKAFLGSLFEQDFRGECNSYSRCPRINNYP